MRKAIAFVSWVIVAWVCYIFLGSLKYKFTLHPDTVHIFGTIGDWLGTFLGSAAGELFSRFGSYVVGSFELLVSIVLLAPILLWLKSLIAKQAFGKIRIRCHQIGGLLASMVMAGAVFFHLASPLGIEVLHQGQSDGGRLFKAAVSIVVLGIVLFAINRISIAISPESYN